MYARLKIYEQSDCACHTKNSQKIKIPDSQLAIAILLVAKYKILHFCASASVARF